MKEINSYAPTRVDAGGPTDVDVFYEKEGSCGYIFNAAILPSAFVRLIPRTGQRIIIQSGDYNETQIFPSIKSIDTSGNLALIKAATLYKNPPGGFELFVKTDIPPGSGLGTSASVAIATLSTLDALISGENYKPDKMRLIREALYLESEYLHNTGGSQDQYAAAFGGFNGISFKPRDVQRRQIDIPKELLKELQNQLLIVHSGKSRFSGKILDTIVEKYHLNDPHIHLQLRKIALLAKEIENVTRSGDIPKLGNLLTEIWEAQKSLHKDITTEDLELISSAASDMGAYGSKALGAGGGGSILIACPPDKKAHLAETFKKKHKIIEFSFSESGIRTTFN